MRTIQWGALAAMLLASGCGDSGTETNDSTTTGSAASGGGTGGDGATSSASAGGSAGGGMGGAGGAMPPLCNEAACAPPGDGVMCGCDNQPDHPACEGVCGVSTFASPLPQGVTLVRLAPISETLPGCATGCDGAAEVPAATLNLRLPNEASCVTVDGPESLRYRVDLSTNPPGPYCSNNTGTFQCGQFELFGGDPTWLVMAISGDVGVLPDQGALVRIAIGAPGTCDAPLCNGGCSGGGG